MMNVNNYQYTVLLRAAKGQTPNLNVGGWRFLCGSCDQTLHLASIASQALAAILKSPDYNLAH